MGHNLFDFKKHGLDETVRAIELAIINADIQKYSEQLSAVSKRMYDSITKYIQQQHFCDYLQAIGETNNAAIEELSKRREEMDKIIEATVISQEYKEYSAKIKTLEQRMKQLDQTNQFHVI